MSAPCSPRNVVADLAVESEAFLWTAMRLAHALDRSETSEMERKLSRIATPVAKYWACKRAPTFVAEALECHGGNGFIEEHLMARLYREAPLNGIWEGTGNVICLDVLRSLQRDPDTAAAFLDELRTAQGADARFDAFIATVGGRLAGLARADGLGRALWWTKGPTATGPRRSRRASIPRSLVPTARGNRSSSGC